MLAPPYSSAHGDAEHAEVPHLAPQVHRKLVGAVDLGRARRDLGLREIAHRVAQRLDVVAEAEVESGELHGCLQRKIFATDSHG